MRKWFRVMCLLSAAHVCVFAAADQARASDLIETAGTVLSIGLPVAAGGLTFSNDDGLGRLQLAASELATFGVTYGLKAVVDESRPDGGSQSFPSAHTSVSFAAADFMRKRYGWEYGAPAFALAGFVGYSRVEANRHHVHDVLAGAAIGILAGELLTTQAERLRVSVAATDDAAGIRLSYAW